MSVQCVPVAPRSIWHATVAAALEQEFLSGAPGAPDVAELAHHYLLRGHVGVKEAGPGRPACRDPSFRLAAP